MNRCGVLILGLVCTFVLRSGFGQQFIDEAFIFGGEPEAVSLPFAVSQGGEYVIRVTDLGAPGGVPDELAAIYIAIVSGNALIASTQGAGEHGFNASPGDYKAIAIGVPQSNVGSLGLSIVEIATDTAVLETIQTFEIPEDLPDNPVLLTYEIAIPDADTYEIEITDFALPAGLASLSGSVILPPAGAPVVVPGAGIVSYAANPGTHTLALLAAREIGSDRALLGINVRRSGAETIFSHVEAIGEWPYQYEISTAAAGNTDVLLSDLAFPAMLGSLAGVVTGDGLLLAALTAGATQTVSLNAGTYSVIVDAMLSGSTPGSFGLTAAGDATDGIDLVQAVEQPQPENDIGTLSESFEILEAGDYTLDLADFGLSGFFDAFDTLELALIQDINAIDTLNTQGAIEFSAEPGSYQIVVVADPAGSDGSGLLGIEVRGGPSDALVFETTAAIGDEFISRQISFTGDARIDVQIEDLGFPGAFDRLRVAVTRGATRAGEIIGGGPFSFEAVTGTYFLNLIAAPDSATGYSLLGLDVGVAQNPPTLELTASAASVPANSDVTLSWTSTNATSCEASNAWSGAKDPSGTETIFRLTQFATFALTCTGAGGSITVSAQVGVTGEQRSDGGGGSFGVFFLLAVLGAVLARRRREAITDSAYRFDAR